MKLNIENKTPARMRIVSHSYRQSKKILEILNFLRDQSKNSLYGQNMFVSLIKMSKNCWYDG